jgi:HD-GYP domain-containing protein (c-di-GMP phosphodiesterase class II)
LFTADVEKVFHGIDELGSWDAVLDSEPSLAVTRSPAECDTALTAIARFVDLKSPYLLGHSQAVADLAAAAARQLGMSVDESQALHRACLVSGLGRLGVSNAIWDKQAPLTAGEWERVRLHPHLTERMLHRSEALASIGRIAVQLRERLDGSGYPRGLTAPAITRPGRILAAADAYQAMREPDRTAPPCRRTTRLPRWATRCAPVGWTVPRSTACCTSPDTTSVGDARSGLPHHS